MWLKGDAPNRLDDHWVEWFPVRVEQPGLQAARVDLLGVRLTEDVWGMISPSEEGYL